MRSLRALLHHPLAGPAIRYGIAGGCVAAVYLGVPLLLNGVLGLWIEIAIPIGYALAICLHFNLQRRFVFRHVDEFALTTRQQIGRYVAIAAVQYPSTALAEAFLPKALGINERVTFVIITIAISVTFFLVLRGHVFHPDAAEEQANGAAAEGQELALDAAPARDVA